MKDLNHYIKQEQELIHKIRLLNSQLVKISMNLQIEHTSSDFPVEISFYDCIRTSNVAKLSYQKTPSNIEAIFSIDKNNITRVNINDKNRNKYQTGKYKKESELCYSYFIKDIKNLINKKNLLLEIRDDIQDINKKIDINMKKIAVYQKLIKIKKQQKIINQFYFIFKKNNVQDLHCFIDTNYKSNIIHDSYNIIPFVLLTIKERCIIFTDSNVKIFNYKKNNEYYVYKSKLIKKDKLLHILSQTIQYKNNLIKITKDMPFNKKYPNIIWDYNIIEEFIKEENIVNKINKF
jgi:hypothetical protein